MKTLVEQIHEGCFDVKIPGEWSGRVIDAASATEIVIAASEHILKLEDALVGLLEFVHSDSCAHAGIGMPRIHRDAILSAENIAKTLQRGDDIVAGAKVKP